MNKNEMITKTKKEVDDISKKLSDLKDKLTQSGNLEMKNEVKATLDKLDDLNRKIQKEYNLISNASENDDTRISEMEKNIYNSIESFHNAFTKAGSLFKTH